MGWYDAVKDAYQAAERLKDSELMRQLAGVQVECAKLAEENAQLREERNQLKERLDLREVMDYDENVCWRRQEDGSHVGPYCPTCWQGHQNLVRMEERSDDHYRRCHVCRTQIAKPGRDPAFRTHAESDYDPLSGQ